MFSHQRIQIFFHRYQSISDRNNGIGFDQILLVDPTPSKFKVKILNSDGSPAQTCFNGLRCIAGLWIKNQIISAPGGDVLCNSTALWHLFPLNYQKRTLEKLSIANIGNNHAIYEVKK